MTIRLDSDDVSFLGVVIKTGNAQQAAAARSRLEDLMRLDAMAGGEGHIYLDSKDDDPVEAARRDMIERNRNKWRMDATHIQPSDAEQPRNFRMVAEEDEAEKARAAMIERNRNAWRKKSWEPGQD